MPSTGQELVRSLFDYVIAYTQIKSPYARNIVQQPWFQYLGEVPQHETIQFTPPVSSDAASGWQLLKVGRARLVEPPRLPEILLDWIDADWKTQQDPRPAPQREAILDGEIKVEQFEDLPERVAAYTDWLLGFKAWSTADRSARAALKLFEKLYEVHGILQRENELWELAVGDGFLFHGPAQVEHPLLIHALQLDFDPKVPAFTVTTTLKSPEIYVALLTILGLDGRHLNAMQEELEGGAYSPLGAEETTAFLKGLVQRFGNGVFCESKATAPTDSPALFRRPVLFLRRRDTGFGRALSAIAQAIDAGVQPSEAILKIVGAVGTGLNAVLAATSLGGSELGDGAEETYDAANAQERQGWDDRDVLFSKESNAEQFEIAHRLRSQKAVLVQGPPGTGKTHIALALGLAACQRGHRVRFTTTAALVSELIEARDDKKLLRFQKQIASYELLIVDELGFVPLSKTGAELLFEMLSQRYERGSTMVTSNLPFQEWTEVLGSERLTGALLDRLTRHVHILEMNGDSYRLKQSRRKRTSSSER